MTHPKSNQIIPHPLLTDLLDPALSLPEVARRHDLPLPEVAQILESKAFAEAAAVVVAAAALRADLLRPLTHARAFHATCRVMDQDITSAARAESVRKAVHMILRWSGPGSKEHGRTGEHAAEEAARPAMPPERVGSADGTGPAIPESLATLMAELGQLPPWARRAALGREGEGLGDAAGPWMEPGIVPGGASGEGLPGPARGGISVVSMPVSPAGAVAVAAGSPRARSRATASLMAG